MIGRAGIQQIADDFWAAAGGRHHYGRPINITDAVMAALRVPVVHIHGLTFTKANDFLKQIGGSQTAPGGERRLHGLIVADQDTAFIFVDADDGEDER